MRKFLTVFLDWPSYNIYNDLKVDPRKNRGNFDCKSIEKKSKKTKKWEAIDVAFWYEWNLLTRRKGEAKWSSMFLLNFSKATKGGINLLFFFLLLDYICLEWNWKVRVKRTFFKVRLYCMIYWPLEINSYYLVEKYK